ncbi:methyltransferase [Candidatus Woesearchaeota archaeon]|nr:methyltransferase [Candidatus Woesearchaeota archaeon]
MVRCKSGYDPQEDSTMLERYARQCAKGKVLDIGTGSGIQAIAAAQNSSVKSVLAADIQKEVVNYCKKNIKNRRIKFIQSDLFKKIKGKFDTIIFNPPYLPQELKLKDITIEGGKKGYEVIERFLYDVNNFLNPNGIILMVFSSLTKKEKVLEFIRDNLLEFEELEKQHIFFEDIYVCLLRKNELLKKLERRGISNARYLAKGHRGVIFTGLYKNKKIAVKSKNPQSAAVGRIENEAKWLERLNKSKIGPKLLIHDRDYFAYEYIGGDFIIDCLKKSSKGKIKKIIKDIFSQMLALDKLKIDKEEMHHPIKHVIVSKNKPYLIDFERAHYSKSPKNVTQFCQFLMGGYAMEILRGKKIAIDNGRLIQLAKVYKNNPNRANFRKIVDVACK